MSRICIYAIHASLKLKDTNRADYVQVTYSITTFGICLVMTFFSIFDVPVSWPILLVYWVLLFTLTMKRQILHMIKNTNMFHSPSGNRGCKISWFNLCLLYDRKREPLTESASLTS
ncbi:hypothetical protein HYC85_002565 [Camellia sinensis]|uniref:Protein RER1 n=1 Tax=Camellia sinensis TaxID=4442 RepID=A0A7J7IA25_CAMSI|nr:hypothetical protein HYC85_002565 [Camellia sinensis]